MKTSLIPFALLTAGACAQTTVESSGWEFTTALYAPLMGLEGDIGVAGFTPTHVDMSFGDILEELDGGLSGAFEARKGPWSITADAIWLKISTSAPGPVNSYIRFGQDQVMGSLALGYEVYGSESTSVELAAGVALNSIDVDLDFSRPACRWPCGPVPVPRSGWIPSSRCACNTAWGTAGTFSRAAPMAASRCPRTSTGRCSPGLAIA